MQEKKASQLRLKWGNKHCPHTDIEKEYYLGAQTDDYVCTKCGKEFSSQEYASIMSEREYKVNRIMRHINESSHQTHK